MKGILAKKLGMTQIFKEGKAIPVTVLKAGPCYVVDKRTPEKNGYAAIVLGFEETKEQRVNKPLLGVFKKNNLKPLKYIKEVRVNPEELDQYEIGQKLGASVFEVGELVDVTGRTKGRGFQGGVKRHGFRGFPDSHGSRYHRAGGSIGSTTFPGRVFKGKTMPGHTGDERVTIQNLEVVEVDAESNLLMVAGAVPGSANSIVFVKQAVKAVV
ncbi:MAG: 50S ribosomal protein L3 [Actinobacteria bacterium]|nr:50S ribosomal protein L3 [Actinomycetota bacterium]